MKKRITLRVRKEVSESRNETFACIDSSRKSYANIVIGAHPFERVLLTTVDLSVEQMKEQRDYS